MQLAKGQLWQIRNAYILIVELGKTLIHYKMMKNAAQRGVYTQVSGISSLQDYLKNNDARLVKAESAG